MIEKIRLGIHNNYHWVIAFVVFLQLAVYGGILNNFSSVFVIPVTEGLGISRGSFSLAVSVKDLVGFISTMFTGALLFRFGYRKMVLLGMMLATLAFAMFSVTPNIGLFAVGTALIGTSSGVCLTAGSARIVGDWFRKYRGTVLGLVSMSTGFGGSLLCVVLTSAIETSGFRSAYRLVAVIFLLITILMFFTIRNRPAEMGLRPLGEGEEQPEKKKKQEQDMNWPGFYPKELFRQPVFYLMAGCTFLSCMCVYLTFYVVVPHMQDCGFSAAEAAGFQSAMLMFLAVAKLLSGVLCDWIGPKKVTILCVILTAVGQWLLAGASGSLDSWAGIVTYSLGLPITTITIPLLTMPLFGYRAYDMAVGVFLAMVSVSAMVAQPLANLVYDQIGSYSPVFRVAAVLDLVIVVLYLLLFKLAARAFYHK